MNIVDKAVCFLFFSIGICFYSHSAHLCSLFAVLVCDFKTFSNSLFPSFSISPCNGEKASFECFLRFFSSVILSSVVDSPSFLFHFHSKLIHFVTSITLTSFHGISMFKCIRNTNFVWTLGVFKWTISLQSVLKTYLIRIKFHRFCLLFLIFLFNFCSLFSSFMQFCFYSSSRFEELFIKDKVKAMQSSKLICTYVDMGMASEFGYRLMATNF